jgi:hypothetical protein
MEEERNERERGEEAAPPGPDAERERDEKLDEAERKAEETRKRAQEALEDGGDDHALLAGRPGGFADGEEPLDLSRHASDRLYLAVLVHEARHGDALPERQSGER